MVPRGGIQIKEICLGFQLVGDLAATGQTNKNTNKIFLWIGSVPELRFALSRGSTSRKPILILARVIFPIVLLDAAAPVGCAPVADMSLDASLIAPAKDATSPIA
jgi:hypothetical protein